MNANWSCYIKTYLIQFKHMISLNKIFDISKVGKWWNRTILSAHSGLYISPMILNFDYLGLNDEKNCDCFENYNDNRNKVIIG